jgi:hypothetical protein
MSYTFTKEHEALAEKVLATLDTESDPNKRQKALEIVLVEHCRRIGTVEHALHIADQMLEHVTYLIPKEFPENSSPTL